MKSEEDVEYVLTRLDQAIEDSESDVPHHRNARIEYCTECDEYWLDEMCDCEHKYDSIIVADHEATSLLGYKAALEWVLE